MQKRLISALKLCWGHFFGKRLSLRDKMDLLFTANPDPWRFETSAYEKEKYERTLGILPHREFRSILEVGCAEGVFTKRLAPYGRRITALDISEVALGRARERCCDLPSVEFKVFDLLNDGFQEEYDLICASEVLYFLDDLDRIRTARDKLLGALCPGGNVLLCHMRLKKEESDGSGRTPLSGHPTLGAASIHRLFIEETALSHAGRICDKGYIIDLLKKEQ